MRAHLYEFRSATRKLICTCGWARVLKSTQAKVVLDAFSAHCKAATLAG